MLAICDIGFKLPKKSDLGNAAVVFFRIVAPLESMRNHPDGPPAENIKLDSLLIHISC